MPSLVIDNTVQVKLTWALSGAPAALNVLHGIKEVGITVPTQSGVNDLFTDLKARFTAGAMRNNINTTWALHSVSLRDLNSANQPEWVSEGAALGGSSVTELLPLNVALCCTLRTALAGPSYRGRYFQTGWTEGVSTGGVATAAAATNLAAWVTDIKGAMDTAGLELAVASRKLGISNAVTSIVTRDTRWDTQRRRIIPGI